MSALLAISDLHVAYGGAEPVVKGVNIDLGRGDLRVILGANGAGKTTIMRAIVGLIKASRGSIVFNDDVQLLGMRAHRINRLGIAWVPEGRQIWATLTVRENLAMAILAHAGGTEANRRMAEIFATFPILEERKDQPAGSLSGGEQSLLAIARALVTKPRLILMDEPSLGLSPMMVRTVFKLVKEISESGISILMVEQNARQALKIAKWAYLLEVGKIVVDGPADQLASSEAVREVFLGGKA